MWQKWKADWGKFNDFRGKVRSTGNLWIGQKFNIIINELHTCVIGSFIISTSVTVPNIPKYSRSFSLDVCQLRPPTNSLPGAVSFAFGVDLPDDELPPLDNAWLLLELVLVIVLFTFCTLLLLLLPLQFIVAALTGIKALCKSCSTEFASMTPLEIERERKKICLISGKFVGAGSAHFGIEFWRFSFNDLLSMTSAPINSHQLLLLLVLFSGYSAGNNHQRSCREFICIWQLMKMTFWLISRLAA